MVRNPIPVALSAFISGLAIVMTVFTLADISAGARDTALIIGVFAWPIVALIAGAMARMLQRDKLQVEPPAEQ